MEHLIFYIALFCVIVLAGQLFRKSVFPLALILVITGMLLSLIPYVPEITLDSGLVLNVFLPLLIYQISAFSSWRDIRKQIRPIASLSVGHVVFITCLVAVVIHGLLPQLGWPLAFVLGATISPPDDVAIVAICEKIRIPERIFIILEGEGMFNDAAALILFRFALAAAVTHTFSALHAFTAFIAVIIGETLYGLILGTLLGKIRLKIKNATLHMIASIITPFLAYIPAVMLGGTGVLATAVVGFLIGNKYSVRFTPEFRLISFGIWPVFAFAIENLIFLMVGLDMRGIFTRISIIPPATLLLYVSSICFVVIIGRFIWVYSAVLFNAKILFPRRQGGALPTLRNAFLISWAGMRGGISLAAALAVPALIFRIDGIDLRDLLIFLVFCTILVTLVLQGLSLPWIMKKFGYDKVGRSERYQEHLSELNTRVQMMHAAHNWLHEFRKEIREDKLLLDEIDFHIREYQDLLKKFQDRISIHDGGLDNHDEILERKDSMFLLRQIVKAEKKELLRLWREDKINLRTRNKLLSMLDHQLQRYVL